MISFQHSEQKPDIKPNLEESARLQGLLRCQLLAGKISDYLGFPTLVEELNEPNLVLLVGPAVDDSDLFN